MINSFYNISLMPSNNAENFAIFMWLKGGEKRTVEFMESQPVVDSSTPLLTEKYAYGVVEHPFPLNCFIRDWHLGSDFYHAVKIGIVQYVCDHLFALSFF